MKVYGYTSDNQVVFAHPEGHPHREDLVAEALSHIVCGDSTFVRQTVDLGRVIGVDHLIETTDDDKIAYMTRGNRAGQSRMVLNREAAPTSFVTCIICKCDASDPEYEGKWVVVTLFEGKPGEREPWDKSLVDKPEAKAKAEAFWSTHALVPTEEERKVLNGSL